MAEASQEQAGLTGAEQAPPAAGQTAARRQSRLARDLMGAGTMVVIVAIGWWFYFFGQAAIELDSSPLEAIQCLYSRAGGCGFLAGMAQLAGITPYHPGVFWLGIAVVVMGVLVRLSANDQV